MNLVRKGDERMKQIEEARLHSGHFPKKHSKLITRQSLRFQACVVLVERYKGIIRQSSGERARQGQGKVERRGEERREDENETGREEDEDAKERNKGGDAQRDGMNSPCPLCLSADCDSLTLVKTQKKKIKIRPPLFCSILCLFAHISADLTAAVLTAPEGHSG